MLCASPHPMGPMGHLSGSIHGESIERASGFVLWLLRHPGCWVPIDERQGLFQKKKKIIIVWISEKERSRERKGEIKGKRD